MTRTLPCKTSRCAGVATLVDGQRKPIPYEIGVTPSAFRTPGQTFKYKCLGCGQTNELSKQAFFALLVK